MLDRRRQQVARAEGGHRPDLADASRPLHVLSEDPDPVDEAKIGLDAADGTGRRFVRSWLGVEPAQGVGGQQSVRVVDQRDERISQWPEVVKELAAGKAEVGGDRL